MSDLSTDEPRALTPDECRDEFLGHLWALVDFWEREGRACTRRELLCGMAHSILAALDGNVGMLPAFIVAPSPHEDDQAYSAGKGENWWPTDEPDIAGQLAYQMYRYAERHGIRKD
jgi:hypothetical protein